MLIVTGSEGKVGRRLCAGLGDCLRVDRRGEPDILLDLTTGDYDASGLTAALAQADAVIHLGANPSPNGKVPDHAASTVGTARLVWACSQVPVPRLILASSTWADPDPVFQHVCPYTHAKRALEDMAAMYDELPGCLGVAIRIGWVPHHKELVDQPPDYLAAIHWDDDYLLARFREPLDAPLPPVPSPADA